MNRWWLAVFAVMMATNAAAEDFGRLLRNDGTWFKVIDFNENHSEENRYYLKLGKHFVALSDAFQIAQVGQGLRYSPSYRILLKSGEFYQGALGKLFYRRVPVSGTSPTRYAFVAVLKERNNDGFTFKGINEATGTLQHVEIANPNDILEIIIPEARTAASANAADPA